MNNKIKLIDVKTDNISEYYKTNLLLVFPYCSGKCGEECQNKHLHDSPINYYSVKSIINLYNSLKTHEAVVCAGLEPFDSIKDLDVLVKAFLKNKKPVDFIIYTGYEQSEIDDSFKFILSLFKDIGKKSDKLIIKFGRYNEKFKTDNSIDENLGIKLATSNQYTVKFSIW